jgi:hypothetical protein
MSILEDLRARLALLPEERTVLVHTTTAVPAIGNSATVAAGSGEYRAARGNTVPRPALDPRSPPADTSKHSPCLPRPNR